MALSLHEILDNSQSGANEADGGAQARKSFQPYHSQSVPKSKNLEAHAVECAANGVPVTTMMLRNIPNKYTQNTLLQEINDQGFNGAYDFFYLPMDVHNRSNVGYAFINFERPTDAERFRRTFSDHRFQRFHSRKIGSVCTAHVQGLDENLRHFENRAVTQARNDQYRPIVLKSQIRVDFEDAVADAKARLDTKAANGSPQETARATAPQTAQQAPKHQEQQSQQAPQQPTRRQARRQQQAEEKGKQPRQPQPPVPQSQPKPTPEAKKPAPPAPTAHDAGRNRSCSISSETTAAVSVPSPPSGTSPTLGPREGLEAAIRELLCATGSASATGGSATPSTNGDPLVSRQTTPAEGAAGEASSGGDADITQLLSLRSLLVDRLCDKQPEREQQVYRKPYMMPQVVGTLGLTAPSPTTASAPGNMCAPPGLEPSKANFDPAYIKLSGAQPLFVKLPEAPQAAPYDEWSLTTPRTNDLFLGRRLPSFDGSP